MSTPQRALDLSDVADAAIDLDAAGVAIGIAVGDGAALVSSPALVVPTLSVLWRLLRWRR
jgi:hypothetical protein